MLAHRLSNRVLGLLAVSQTHILLRLGITKVLKVPNTVKVSKLAELKAPNVYKLSSPCRVIEFLLTYAIQL